MLAIIEQWDMRSGCHIDNNEKYLFLVLFKLGLDAAVFHLCCRKLHASFLSMCSLSILLADLVMGFSFVTLWFLGSAKSPVSPCFLLANASTTYGAMPLPMMLLGLLDFFLQDGYLRNQRPLCRNLRNAAIVLLLWILAMVHSFGSVKAQLKELHHTKWIKAHVCEVEESTLINNLIVLLFVAVVCVIVPYCSRIPKWLKKADRLSEEREEQDSQKSDLLFISTSYTETENREKSYVKDDVQPHPPLWLSLMLGFGVFWMPYLAICTACLVLGLGVPAYITVNVLWLECTNSLLMGVVFWAKSDTLGPYSHLPDNVCLWHVFWHLSKGTGSQQLPVAVFNPSKEKRTTLFYV